MAESNAEGKDCQHAEKDGQRKNETSPRKRRQSRKDLDRGAFDTKTISLLN